MVIRLAGMDWMKGLDLKDINYDGLIDVTSSRVAMRRFHEAMGNAKDSVLIIKDV